MIHERMGKTGRQRVHGSYEAGQSRAPRSSLVSARQWATGKYHQMLWRDREVVNSSPEHLVLTPSTYAAGSAQSRLSTDRTVGAAVEAART